MSLSKLSIAVVCEANPAKNPRPNRVISLFKEDHKVTAIGREAQNIEGVDVFSYALPPKRSAEEELRLVETISRKEYKSLIEIPTRKKIKEVLQKKTFDLIFCHDLVLLPLVLASKRKAKVIFDAREFYPREKEEDERWCRLFKEFNEWMCHTYLHQADYCYTVSSGLANAHRQSYGVHFDVVMSLPEYHTLSPSPTDEKIRIIHHGAANRDRDIIRMIETADHLDERFHIDFMLVENFSDHFFFLKEEIEKRSNVSLIPPVDFKNIIPFISRYDIGFYILPPTNFNLLHALPNKFFEFIQARLAIAIAPSLEMAHITRMYEVGVVSEDFTAKRMAEVLNALTPKRVEEYKQHSHKAAQILRRKKSDQQLLSIVQEVIHG